MSDRIQFTLTLDDADLVVRALRAFEDILGDSPDLEVLVSRLRRLIARAA